MDKGRKVRRGLVFFAAGLLCFHTPLAAMAEEADLSECICDTACTDEERNEDCPLCGRQDADTFACDGETQDEIIQDEITQENMTQDEIIQEDEDKNRTAKKEQPGILNPQETDNDASGGLIFEWTQDLPKTEKSYSAGEGQIIWTPKLSGGEVVSGTLTLKNAVINSAGTGIHTCVPVAIKVEGVNQITSGSLGICALRKQGDNPPGLDISLSGTGTLKINSKGDGIQTGGNIMADTVRLEIVYGAASENTRGLATTYGNIELRNSKYIKVKSNPAGIGSNSSAVFAGQVSGQKLRIENCHLIAINGDGPAINVNFGNIELVSSDVRAVGNTSTELVSGTLSFGGCMMNGGSLFADNKGSDLAFPSVATKPLKASNSAVFYDGKEKGLFIEGDLVWYMSCIYNEAADEITGVDRCFALGNVTWNNNMRLGTGKAFTIGYVDKPSSLTIPKGVTVEMTDGSWFNVGNSGSQPKSRLINNGTINVNNTTFINNFPDSAIVNNGTVNILSGGKIYNFYILQSSKGGVFQNNAQMTISQGGMFQNQGRLENSGTINAVGTFLGIRLPNYDGSIDGKGRINGFMVEMHSDSTVYAASGQTVLKRGQTLTLKPAAGTSKATCLKVLEGAELVVEEGATIDAKTHLTAETVASVIDLRDTIIVNGILLLPEDVSEETVARISQNIAGTGSVKFGDETRHIITVDKGNGIESQFLRDGEKAVLPSAPVRDGYRFEGWYIKNGNALEPFDEETQFYGSAEIISKWKKLAAVPPRSEAPSKSAAAKTDMASNACSLNKKAQVSLSGSKLKVSWGVVSGASGYDIYAGKCGSKARLVKTVGGSKASCAISRIGKKKISGKGSYKVWVQAYRIVNGKKETIGKSMSFHVVGKNRKGYTNAKKIKVSKSKLTVKKGGTKKIKAKTVKQSRRKKLLSIKHIAPYRYFSTNEKVASVSKTGKIKGKKKGSCTIYVVAANGVKKGIKVTVK